MRPRISIRGSVRPSVGPSVRPSVRRSVRNQLFSKSKNEGFPSCILTGKPRNITEMSNCISIGSYTCWSVRLSILKVEKKVVRTHLLVDQTCCCCYRCCRCRCRDPSGGDPICEVEFQQKSWENDFLKSFIFFPSFFSFGFFSFFLSLPSNFFLLLFWVFFLLSFPPLASASTSPPELGFSRDF